MARKNLAPGEKPVLWIGSSKIDLLDFPESVKERVGVALSVAQFGGKHPHARPWKGIGPGVLEIREDYRGDTYRTVYTVRFDDVVYVLHSFKKKSPNAIRTAVMDIDLIGKRLKAAENDYVKRYAQEKD